MAGLTIPNKPAAQPAIACIDLLEIIMSGPYEWRINDIERAANEANRRLHELDTLRSNVDRMECALRESCAKADGLRSALETANQRLEQLEQQIGEVLSFTSNDQIETRDEKATN